MSEEIFSVFDLKPAPVVDADAVKEKFARLSSELHPDKFQQLPPDKKKEAEERYARVNRAYQILREPKERLLYLYELERGGKPPDVQKIPPGTMDLFIEVGQLCQKVDTFLKEKNQASSVLEKASLMARSLEFQDETITLQNKIAALEQQLDLELIALDQNWRKDVKDLDQLEALYRKHSYVNRWKQQLEERQLALLTN
jgi:curved DNA-binding protein CbpA